MPPLCCTYCNREFSIKSNLTRHIRLVHNVFLARSDIQPGAFEDYHFKCLEGCSVSFRYNRELRKHLQNEHNVEINEIHLEFPNKEEFEKWKQVEETENYVQYVHQTASKKSSRGGETFYYECSRSGRIPTLKEEERKRRPRKHGTVKLNRGCTSQIIVTKSFQGSISVIYFKTHYGHDLSVDHVRLSEQERIAIASKLSLGISAQHLLHSVKNSTKQNSALRRMNLIGTKDVSNIKKSFNLTSQDAIDVNLFVDECALLENNPVLYCNLQHFQSDLSLVIMTKYQSEQLSKYGNNIIVITTLTLDSCGFELVILVVVNEGRFFPVACSFTNKVEEDFLELFLAKIRDVSGAITPKILLTNSASFYYNIWLKVMGAPQRHLYNLQQLNLEWELNLNRIHSDEMAVGKMKRKWAFETLKALQSIKNHHDEFKESLDSTAESFALDPDFREFREYFQQFCENPEKWASTYRKDLHIPQSSIVVEILKEYFNQEHCYRIDKIFHSLIRFIRDETVNSLMEDSSNRTELTTQNYTRHLNSTEKRFSATQPIEETFNVTDLDCGKSYLVQQHLEKICCNLTCSYCHICVHCFSCSCVDFFLSNSICTHIHYVCITYFQSIVDDNNCYDEEIIIQVDPDDVEIENVHVAEVCGPLQVEIVEKSAVLSQNVKHMHDTDKLEIVLDTINKLCDFTDSENANSDNLLSDEHCYIVTDSCPL